ncbi:hypothetical protein DSM25558_2898 [Agrobacterium sp. DSM 25558]|uniref:hypothetical protein n=1 Tax=Agrobacterium sp. DSM 25558 TaxID=1907665 RepID=UPI0009724ACD|nr:hypothetical protein [Agrobacterium sp. DSM 25558]SCX21310.1 hypothetical protein DSM25558_2898 [Agrobacterium sp. DSM 25558]
MAAEIEVFRDMSLHGPSERRAKLREALIAAASGDWDVDLERSAEVKSSAVTDADVVLFRCAGNNEHPAAGLTLWETQEGYYVPNVVPLEFGSLTKREYNAILQEFIDAIAQPVAYRLGFELRATESRQTLADWVSDEVGTKLKRFSGAANKSTGASHPSDERRWFDFIVAAHRRHERLDPGTLFRWLHEAEGWDEETAHKLAGDYENARALLKYSDEDR